MNLVGHGGVLDPLNGELSGADAGARRGPPSGGELGRARFTGLLILRGLRHFRGGVEPLTQRTWRLPFGNGSGLSWALAATHWWSCASAVSFS